MTERRAPRSLTVLVAAAASVAVALTGCTSGSSHPAAATSATSTTPAPTSQAPSPFTARGIPADLASVVRPLYLGGRLVASPGPRQVLARRKALTTPVVVTGSVARWQGTPIAVVTTGKDVTLAVKAPTWRVVGGWWPSLGVPGPVLGGVRRVLFIGSDARVGEDPAHARGDSLHIVGFDGHHGGGIVGIARDAYVPLTTGGRGKINSALVYGGPKAQVATVRAVTGVPLEGYVLTGFKGFTDLVNAVHGLKINVPVAVKDIASHADVKAGPNVLGGREALAYARARHTVAGGDFGRSLNQGRVMLAAGMFVDLAGPLKLPALLQLAAAHVTSDLTAEQVLTLAANTYVTDPRKVPNKVAAGGFGWTADRQSIVLLDAAARRLFVDIRDGNLS